VTPSSLISSKRRRCLWIVPYSILAVPCDDIQECYLGEDESPGRCSSGKFNLPYLIGGIVAGCLVIFSLILIGHCRSTQIVINLDTEELPDDLSRERFLYFHSKKHLQLPVASFQQLSEGRRIEVNRKLLCFEKEVHGGDINEAICCLKVSCLFLLRPF
jgi:hypothetical protein